MRFSPRPTESASAGPAVRALTTLLLVCLCILALGECRPGDPEAGETGAEAGAPSVGTPGAGTPGAGTLPGGLWFQLQEGHFEPIQGPADIQPRPMRPWTVQERVATMVEDGTRPYLAVNGYGVAALIPTPTGFPQFRPFYDPLLFGYRTFTRILPREQSLLCHLYFNSLLNETTADALELEGISLLELFPEEGVYRHRTPPFQRQHPRWECVGLAPAGDQVVILAWKHSAPAETRFAYTRLELAGDAEQAASQEEYRRAMAFSALDQEVAAALRSVALEAAARLDEQETATGLQFLVRGRSRDGERRLQILPPGFAVSKDIALLTVPVEKREDRFTALTPDGTLLWAGQDSDRPGIRHLPRLPAGFVYTDLLQWELLFVAAWEERAFTDVGAAGLVVFQDPELFP